MGSGLAMASGFLAVAVAVMVVAALWLRKLREETARELERELGADAVWRMDPGANCFGVRSVGVAQVRGNGCLALTDDALVFRMWTPRKTLVIPRDRVLEVDTARSHLGKSKGIKLLRVRFTNDAGQPDVVAWAVRHLDDWLEDLERRRDGGDGAV